MGTSNAGWLAGPAMCCAGASGWPVNVVVEADGTVTLTGVVDIDVEWGTAGRPVRTPKWPPDKLANSLLSSRDMLMLETISGSRLLAPPTN